MQSIDPSTGEVIATYNAHSLSDATRAVEAAALAQVHWRALSFSERGAFLKRTAIVLRRDKEQHAVLMAREMGKPLEQGRAEIEKCASSCDYFADHAEQFLSLEEIKTEAARSYVLFQPLGV